MKHSLSLPIVFGHAIECFNSTLYGFFAVLLSPIFFPSDSYRVALLASYGAFAAGFLARPLGAILFGLIGDKYGRKNPLLLSMMLVGVPTIGIGLVPSHDELGIWAPVLLVICIFLQGLFIGGEFAGVNLYITESSSKKGIGAKTGLLISSGVFGAVFATLTGAFVSMETMPSWAWRIPFLAGGVSSFFIYLFRNRFGETEEFMEAKSKNKLLIFPWKELFSNHKLNLVIACLITGLTIMPLYFATIFGNRLFKEIGFSAAESMMLNTAAMMLDACLIIFFGRLADRIGFYQQVILGSSLTAIVSIPAFYMISITPVYNIEIFIFIAVLVISGCIINGCSMPYISGFFPTNCRYSGVALSVTVGHALFGGTAPLMGSFLIDITGSRVAPAFWLTMVSVAAALSVWMTRKR